MSKCKNNFRSAISKYNSTNKEITKKQRNIPVHVQGSNSSKKKYSNNKRNVNKCKQFEGEVGGVVSIELGFEQAKGSILSLSNLDLHQLHQ